MATATVTTTAAATNATVTVIGLAGHKGAWYSQMTSYESFLYIAGYPLFVFLASRFLAQLGLNKPFYKHHLLATQVLRFCNACGAIGYVLYALWNHPYFLSSMFTNHEQAAGLDFLARFVGCGFHIADQIDIVYAHYMGYMPGPFRWDLILHHLSVCVLAIAYNYLRAEGCLCLLFLSDVLPIPTFFILLFRALEDEKLCSPARASHYLTAAKIVRLVLIAVRMPLWFVLAWAAARGVKESVRESVWNVHPAMLALLAFAALIVRVDVKWMNQMIVGLSFSLKNRYPGEGKNGGDTAAASGDVTIVHDVHATASAAGEDKKKTN